MNLLDDPNKAGILSLGLRLMSTPGKFGSALGQAGLGAMGDIQQAKQAQAMAKQKALQEQMLMMQLEQIKAQQAAAKGAQERQANDQGLMQRLMGMPVEGMMPQGQMGPGMPSANSGVDPRAFLNQGGSMAGLQDVIGLNQILSPPKKAPLITKPGDIARNPETGEQMWSNPEAPEKDDADVRLLKLVHGENTPAFFSALSELAKKKTTHAPATNVNVGGTKYQDAFDVANAKNFADSFGQINTAGMQAGQTLANLDRMEQLLTGVDGGKLLPAGKEIASVAESFGVRLDPKLGNKEAAEALSVEMALAMRPPGSGPMTDKDFSNFLMTVPGLSKTPAGRAQITATMRAKAMRDEKMADLAQQYVEQNGRLDSGFYKVARDFIASNPVVRRSTSADVRSQADAILEGGK